MSQNRTVYRTCPLCEASCGLEITVRGDEVTRIRGDDQDVFSRGFLCPKGTSLKALHEDPDRLRTPRFVVRLLLQAFRKRAHGKTNLLENESAFADRDLARCLGYRPCGASP